MQINSNNLQFLPDGGGTGKLIREKDWSNTSLGDPASWPQSLRTTLNIILGSRLPMFLFWGPEMICFYNDAFMPIFRREGEHPDILGSRRKDYPQEIWKDIQPVIDRVLTEGESVSYEDILLPLYRNGFEYVNLTFCFSAVNDESGNRAGIFVTAIETTGKISALKIPEGQEKFGFTKSEENEALFSTFTNNIQNLAWKKLAGIKIRARENLFHQLAEQAPMWIWLTDKEVNILYANADLLQFVGIAHLSDFTGKIWEKVVHPEDIASVYKNYNEGTSRQTTFSFECRIKNAASGLYEWIFLKVVARYEAGEFAGFIGTAINIQEQKATIEILEYRRILLETYNQANLNGVLLVDSKGKILSYNKRFIEIWNMPQHIIDAEDDEAALAHAMTQLVEPEQFFEKVKYLYGHPTDTIKDELKYKDGKIVERYGYPVVGEDGTYYAWSWTFRDITKEKNDERIIKESEERFRLLAESLPQLVWLTDDKGNQEYASNKWEAYTGIKPGGRDEWKAIVHPHDFDMINDAWLHSLTTSTHYSFDVRLKGMNGEFRWFKVNGEPVVDSENKIIKWVGAFTDIHIQKSFANELELKVKNRTNELAFANKLLIEKNDELTKMNKELQSFMYISSHDLQEPLRKIQVFSDQIIEKEYQNLSVKGRDQFLRMQKTAARMQQLIKDLLAFSSIATADLKFEKTDLNKILDEIKKDLKEELKDKQATIDAAHLCHTNIIPFQFRQLIYNIIGNSLKFSNPELSPLITINNKIAIGEKLNNKDLNGQQRYCHISVSDNGIGFENKHCNRIFEVFQRLHDREKYSGTGIGLAIVKKIVENHNGIITAKGEPDKGATFDIFIPAD